MRYLPAGIVVMSDDHEIAVSKILREDFLNKIMTVHPAGNSLR